jgi:hypothetical protein
MGAAGKNKTESGWVYSKSHKPRLLPSFLPTKTHPFHFHQRKQIPKNPKKKTNTNTQQLSSISSCSAGETKHTNNLERSTATTQNFQVFFYG